MKKTAKVVKIPKTAQDTIPFIEAYENGLFLMKDNTYSLIFSFENLDYALMREEEKDEKYYQYQKLLDALPSDINYQEFIMNTTANSNKLTDILIPKNRQFGDLYDDYCKIQNDFIDKAESSSAEKVMVIALTYTLINSTDNVNILFKYYRELKNYFNALGSDTKQLMPTDVFKILYEYYHPFEKAEFLLPKNIFSKGGRIKDYIAPSAFVFRSKDIEIGSAYTRVMFVKNYDRELDDGFIGDLLDNSHKITVSKHITRIDKRAALEKIRKEIFAVQDGLQKRKEQNHKRGTDFIPYRLKEKIEELEDLQTQLGGSNTELFRIGVFISISAESKDELEEITKTIQGRALKHQVRLGILQMQQEKGLNTMLPLGINHFNSGITDVNTYLLSDAASILLPFSSRTYFTENGLNYGINKITNSLIVLDRTDEMNANGFVLGASGAGKSFYTKTEISDVAMRQPEDEIIIIDPENEYKNLAKEFNGEIMKIAPNSSTKFNVFDTDLSYSEEGSNAVTMKTDFIMTLIETAKGFPLTANERSIIDRCVKFSYKEYIESSGNPEKLPTLRTFYDFILQQPQDEAKDIATVLELYVTGSFNIFADKTNIEINKKFLVIDIFEMGQQLRTVGLQVILEFVWQRVIENKKKGIRTWIWVDEFSIMLENTMSGKYFDKVFKRIRKHGGSATGITQNISEVLDNEQAVLMLQNSEFVVLLQQKKKDLDKLTNIYELSPTQSAFLKTGEKGSGIIICGKRVIPFEKIIPKTSKMYKIFTTKFEDTKDQNK